ncbi:MAG: DUF3808 domain-containing protein [Bryobacterales bacterium]|nr:DUF3808 domain-containing protein [Bryobacterales bacterium]
MACLAAWLLLPALASGPDRSLPEGFDAFYNLDYDQAINQFEKLAQSDPGHADYQNFVAQAILYREMYRVGALESELVSGNNPFLRRPKMNPPPEAERRFFQAIDTAMAICQTRLKENPADSEALYALGVAHGLRANYNFLVRKAWIDALRDATAARKRHNRVVELNPGNYDARLVPGVHDYVVGSLPLFYKMLGFVAGFRGDREKGIRTLEEVARRGRRNRVDAEILLCALYRREGRPRQALPLLEDLVRRFPRNYLLRFEQAQMHSALGEKGKALAAVEEVARLKQNRAPGYERVSWEKIWFQLGTIQFWYNDLDDALRNMQRVTAGGAETDLNTGVLAWMRVGQIHDLKGCRKHALHAYSEAIRYAPQADAARECRRYLSSPYRRPKPRN